MSSLFFSDFKTSKASACFFPCYLIVFVCFSKAFPWGEYTNLGCSIILLWSDGNISSPVRYLHLPIFLDDNADSFAALLG